MTARMLRRWRRFRALERGDQWLIVEAIVVIAAVQAGVRTLQFARLQRLLAAVKRRRAGSQCPAARIGWAVDAAARLLPGRTCLSDALAADVMLGRRGYQSTLQFGVKKRTDGAIPVEAHAWVECDGSIVAGQIEALDAYRLFSKRGTVR